MMGPGDSTLKTCDGMNPHSASAYAKLFREQRQASSDQQTGQLPDTSALLTAYGQGFPSGAPTQRWHTTLSETRTYINPDAPQYARFPLAATTEIIVWAYQASQAPNLTMAQRQQLFAERISTIATTLSPMDLKLAPIKILTNHIIPARAEYYTQNPGDLPQHKVPAPNGPPGTFVYQQLTAEEQARRDKYDVNSLNILSNAAMFAFDPMQVANNIITLEAILEELDNSLTTEFPASNHALSSLAMRASRISSELMPQPLDLLELMFISQFAEANAATLKQCMDRRIKDSEGGFEAYISTFQTEITTIKRNPAIAPSPAAIYTHLMNVIQLYSKEAYNHLNTIMLTAYPNEMTRTLEALAPHAQKYFTERRKQASMSTLHDTRTRSPVKILPRAPYKPQVRINLPSSGKTVYPAHFSAGPSTSRTFRRNTSPPPKPPCNICLQKHDGYVCPLSAPNITPPPNWTTPQAGTAQYLLFQAMQQASQPQQRSGLTSYSQQPPPRSYNSKQGKGSFYTDTKGPGGGGRPEGGDDTHDNCFMSDDPGESHYTTRQSAQRAATAPSASATNPPRAPVDLGSHNRFATSASAPAPAPASSPRNNTAAPTANPPPFINRTPRPIPFAPTALPRDTPMSQLPTAPRTARQRISSNITSTAPEFNFTATNPAPAPPSLSASLLYLLGLGATGLVDEVLACTPAIRMHGNDHNLQALRLEHMLIDLTALPTNLRRRVLDECARFSSPAAPDHSHLATEAPPSPTYIPTFPTSAPAAPNPSHLATEAPLSPTYSPTYTPTFPTPTPSVPESPTAQAPADPVSFSNLSEAEYSQAMADIEHPPAEPSMHSAADFSNVNFPVTPYPQPRIFTLGPDPDTSAVLTLAGSDTPLHSTNPTLTFIVDTASKLNIIPLSVAQHMNLSYDPTLATSMRTSSGQVTTTLGKVTDVAIILCANDPDKRCGVMVDLDVVDCGNASFDVLLGVQWITAIGAEISTKTSTLTYYTQHPRLRIYEGAVTIPLITTASD